MFCPNCGAQVAEGALSCRECGSDGSTGWSKAAEYAHLLPDDDGLPVPKPKWKQRGVAIVCGLVATAVLWSASIRWAALLAVLAIVGFFLFKRTRGEGSDHALFQQLVARCRDRELAERLIEAERKRSPNASRAQLIRKALDRLSRDRR
jgi:uncharacterized membrane protein YvbJ